MTSCVVSDVPMNENEKAMPSTHGRMTRTPLEILSSAAHENACGDRIPNFSGSLQSVLHPDDHFATPSTQRFIIDRSPDSHFSINPQWTVKSCDVSSAFQFARPITPSVSSRSTTPLSSRSGSVVPIAIDPHSTPPGAVDPLHPCTIDITSSEVSKAVKYLEANLKREYEEKTLEMQYRLRAEYNEKNAIEMGREVERVRQECHLSFESLLKERMKEVVDDYTKQLDEGQIEFEELLKERMAEVQAECNTILKLKDQKIMKLKAKLEASAISGRTAKSKATSTRSKTSLRKNIRVKEKQLWLIESEGEEVEHASGMSEYVKNIIFSLQLNAALERAKLLEAEEELRQSRETIGKYELEREEQRHRESTQQFKPNASIPSSPYPSPPPSNASYHQTKAIRKSSFTMLSALPTPTNSPPVSTILPKIQLQQGLDSGSIAIKSLPFKGVVKHPCINLVSDTNSEYDESSSGDIRSQLQYPDSAEELDELDEDQYSI